MDKRALAAAFRERLQTLLGEERGGVAGFLRDTGIDRSALSQFLDPGIDRLPRAETLRRIAEARGVTVDWLLSLSNAPEGRQEVTPSVQIELAEAPGRRLADRPVAARGGGHEAALRAVEPARHARPRRGRAGAEPAPAPASRRTCSAASGSATWTSRSPCRCRRSRTSPQGAGLWRGTDPGAPPPPARATWRRPAPRPTRRCGCTSSTAARTFAAPFTVFGRIRAAVYLGEAYLVVTSAEQVAALSRLFDNLVRRAVVGPERVHEQLYALADGAPR